MLGVKKAPIWFWVVAILALLWNGIGVAAYFAQVTMSEQQFAALPQVEQQLLAAQPFWYTAAFAIAVFAGLVGSLLMLMRKRLAVRMFLLSLLAVIVQFAGHFIVKGHAEYISSTQGWLMPSLILFIAIALAMFSRKMEKSGILH